MFRELEDQPADLVVTASMSDRQIAWALWCQTRANTRARQGWSILYERHPDRLDFLFLTVLHSGADGDHRLVAGYLQRLEQEGTGSVASSLPALANHLRVDSSWRPDVAIWISKFERDDRLEVIGQTLANLERQTLERLDRETAEPAAINDAPPIAYSARARFAIGDRINHPKFGIGVVRRLLEGKIAIDFAGSERILVGASASSSKKPTAASSWRPREIALRLDSVEVRRLMEIPRSTLSELMGWNVLAPEKWRRLDGANAAVVGDIGGEPLCVVDGQLVVIDHESNELEPVDLLARLAEEGLV